jgi:hypothetical protein
MYHDNNWNPVQGDELAGFLEQINPIDGKYKVSAETTTRFTGVCCLSTTALR